MIHRIDKRAFARIDDVPYRPATVPNSYVNWKQVFLGIAALAVGVLVYLFDRPPGQVLMLSNELSLFDGTPALFGTLGQSLPTFTHVYAFSVITGGLLLYTNLTYKLVCAGWTIVDLFFELGQSATVYQHFEPVLAQWAERSFALEVVNNYFRYGNFDVADVLSIVAGGVFGYYTLLATQQRKLLND